MYSEIMIDHDSTTGYDENFLENEIWKMFMDKGSSIKYLEPTYIDIYYLPSGTNRLRYLSELECSVDVSSIFYFNLAQLCRNIRKLSIF